MSSFVFSSRFDIIVSCAIRSWCVYFSTVAIIETTRTHSSYALAGVPFLILFPFEFFFSFKINRLKDNNYFNPCLCLLSFSILPCVWILQLKGVAQCVQVYQVFNDSLCDLESLPAQTDIAIDFLIDKKILFLEIKFMFTLVLAHWLLPNIRSNTEETYSLVVNSLSMCLDMHELFHLSFKKEIIEASVSNGSTVYICVAILLAWSLSTILLVINSDGKSRQIEKRDIFEYSATRAVNQANKSCLLKWKDQEYLPLIFENFYWKYVITISSFDGPYFLIRMVVLFRYQINDVKHTFFLFKNLLQILFQLIRILGRIYFRMI